MQRVDGSGPRSVSFIIPSTNYPQYEETLSPKSQKKAGASLDRPSSPLERKAKEAEDVAQSPKSEHEDESIVLRRTISLLNAQNGYNKREHQEVLESKDRELENVKNELLNAHQALNSERLARKKAEERVVCLEEEIVKLRRLALAYKTKLAKSKPDTTGPSPAASPVLPTTPQPPPSTPRPTSTSPNGIHINSQEAPYNTTPARQTPSVPLRDLPTLLDTTLSTPLDDNTPATTAYLDKTPPLSSSPFSKSLPALNQVPSFVTPPKPSNPPPLPPGKS